MPPKDCPPNAGDVFVPIVMLVIPACASTALQTREKDVNPARYVTRQSIVRSSTNISILGSVPQSRNCDDRLLPCRRQMSQVCGKHDQNKPDGGCPRDSSAADLSRAVRERCLGLIVFGIIGFAPVATNARVTQINISTPVNTAQAFGGQSFAAGKYQMINGTIRGEIDPKDPRNTVIVDIALAPRNARGKVEYSTDFQLLLPINPSQGNHRLLYEITNRGNTNALTILNSAQTANTK